MSCRLRERLRSTGIADDQLELGPAVQAGWQLGIAVLVVGEVVVITLQGEGCGLFIYQHALGVEDRTWSLGERHVPRMVAPQNFT